MKFCRLIEYNMRKIFLETSYIKWGRETIRRPFLKNQTWIYLWISSLTFSTVCFYCMPSWGLPTYIETKMLTTCFTSYKTLLKTKRGLELVSMPHFLHDFWRKTFILIYSINWPKFIDWLPLLRAILVNMCIVIVF